MSEFLKVPASQARGARGHNLDRQAEPTSPSGLTRREFLKLAGFSAAGALLAACVPVPFSNMPNPSPVPRPLPADAATATKSAQTPQLKEITGFLPDQFNNIIKDNKLIPRIFAEKDTPEQRIEAAVNYLRRFKSTLESRREYRGDPLSSYRINTAENFPIAVPNDQRDASRNWNIYDLVNSFLLEYDSNGQDKSLPRTTITYGKNQNPIEGTINSFNYFNNKLVRTSNILVGSGIMENNFVHYDTPKEIYKRFTDVELAILFLHEYSHGLQGQAIIEMVNNILIGIKSNLDDVGLRQNVIENKTNLDSLTNIVREAADKFNQFKSKKNGLGEISYKMNEAQATAVGYMFLNTLNRLNGSSYFPGTRFSDLSDEELTAMNQTRSGRPVLNLYNHFLTHVVNQPSSAPRALSKEWIIAAGL